MLSILCAKLNKPSFLFEHCVFHPYSFLWLLTGLAAVCQCVHFVLGNPNQDRASNAVSQVLNRELLDLSTFLQQLYLHCVSVKELSAVKICFCQLAFVHLCSLYILSFFI